MTFRVFARLARITNLPTVAADVLAGFLIVAGWRWIGLFDGAMQAGIKQGQGGVPGGLGPPWLALLMLVLAGCCLYTGGMIDNDVQHAGKDRLLRKPRPIVQGEMSREGARFLAHGLMMLGVTLAALSAVPETIPRGVSTPALGLAILIVILSKTYNRLAAGHIGDTGWDPPSKKANFQGVILLALARVAAVGMGAVLGVSQVAGSPEEVLPVLLDTPALALLCTSFAWFALTISLSLFEDFGATGRTIGRMSTLVTLAAWTGPVIVYVTRYDRMMDARWMAECLPALLCLLAASFPVWTRLAAATREPTPRNIGRCIGIGIAAWPLILASMVFLSLSTADGHGAGWRDTAAALTVASMTALAMLLRRISPAT